MARKRVGKAPSGIVGSSFDELRTGFLHALANLREGIEAVAGEYDAEKWHRLESPDMDPESPHYELFERWHALADWFAGIDYTELESDDTG